MRIDPYKHKERYENWKEKVSVSGREGISKNNSDIIIKYVTDMEHGLNVSSTHIANAQSFMTNEGDVFSNKLELLSWLDEKAVYTHTLANSLNTMVENYNSNLAQQQSQYQIDEESLETILKILAMAI